MNIVIKKHSLYRWVSAFSAIIIIAYGLSALAQGSILSSVAVGSSLTRYAAGDSLPVNVTLTNNVAGTRTYLVVNYKISDAGGHDVYSENETVAVEIASSFTHSIIIPRNLKNGEYALTSAVSYPGQVSPATSSFKFTVESKFLGMFVTDLAIWAISIIALMTASALIIRHYVKKRIRRNAPFEYENIASQERMFYEITSDIVAQMRYRIGNKALELADEVQGLKIDMRTGRILKITKEPSEIIAMLIYRYEKYLGIKIITTPEPLGKNMAGVLRPVNQNLSIIEKYFKPKSK
jgi:hypothetical protein